MSKKAKRNQNRNAGKSRRRQMNQKKLTSAMRVEEMKKLERALDVKTEKIRKLLAANALDTARGRYDIARAVQDLMDEKAFGTGAVKKLAKRLGLEWQLLYRWARVAARWTTKAAFEKLLKLRTSKGLPLSWSHFEVLADVEGDHQRHRLLRAALHRCLSVRELSTRAEAKRTNPLAGEAGEPLEDSKHTDDLGFSLVVQPTKFTGELARWRESLKAVASKVSDTKVRTQLEKARQEHDCLLKACRENLAEIDRLLARTEPALSMPEARSDARVEAAA